MPDPTLERLRAAAADGNIDIEDLRFSLNTALLDGVLSAEERGALEAGLKAWGASFEPAARRYLDALLAGKQPELPNRVLLAPHPRGAQRDLYYARADVVGLQEALSAVGVPTGVDGDYGPGTTKSVATFQEQRGLPATGVVDSVTLGQLNEALATKGARPLDLTPRAHIRPDAVISLRGGGAAAVNCALQEALNRLSQHYGVAGLSAPVTGDFDLATETAVKALQARSYLPETGLLDTATLAALNEALEAAGLAILDLKPPEGGAGPGGAVELHFYPGDQEHKLYVIKDGALLATYGMVGGQDRFADDPNNPNVDYGPSPKGSYEVVEVSPHASGAWAWSYVPWGSPLRAAGREVEFQDARGRWQMATGPSSVFAGRNPAPLGRSSYLNASGEVMPRWLHNDFGHLRARLRSLSSGAIQGHMIHSSPDNEVPSAYFSDTARLGRADIALSVLRFSHGCEHIHPADMDALISRGYLAPGTRFVVHGYDERYAGPVLS